VDTSSVLRRIDLNLVPALAALLDQRHVTRAAETLGIRQPAMSAAPARLRRLFGDPLLVRIGRVLELTPMGQALVEPVHDILAGLDNLLTITPAFDPKVDNRSFTIGASDYITLVLLRPLLEQLYHEATRGRRECGAGQSVDVGRRRAGSDRSGHHPESVHDLSGALCSAT
jgi:LysR family transcriptional regulator, nod-box dependent transcriptional activator